MGVFFSGPGQTYGVSSFTASYIHDLHMSRTAVSSLYSAATLASGFTLFLVGKLVDKRGTRVMMTLAAALLGCATLWSSFVANGLMLIISFYFIRLFGQGSLTLIPSTLVSQWFIKYRGRAMALEAVGGLVAASTIPLLNNWMISTFGWHVTWRIWAVILIVLFAPAVAWFVRSKPEAVGLMPDGALAHIGDRLKQQNNPSTVDEVSFTVSEAMRTPAFWCLLFCAFVPAMVNTGITFNIYSVLGSDGISHTGVAMVLSFVPLLGFAVTFLNGFLATRTKIHQLIAVSFAFETIQMLAILVFHGRWMIIMFTIFWGLSQGVQNISIKLSFANYYGRKHLGSINSILMVATVVGSAFGPLPFGYGFDTFHSYTIVLLIMAVFPLISIGLALVAKRPSLSAHPSSDG